MSAKRPNKLNRRQFMGGIITAGAAVTIVPRFVLGGTGHTPPSEKLNIAAIGAGGMGARNIEAVSSENIVALCDVDQQRAAGTFKKYPQARKYKDFRKMLEKEKNIDAVIVATPDHTHAVATMMAIKMGKHVYCQKPLTHTVYEARKITEAARDAKMATQMGNQGHSGEGVRLISEWIRDGAIGPVREVHCWTDRPVDYWPSGIDRPKDTPAVPATLDWDLWLGPAPKRAYHPAYAPFKWRGWWDFGCGALGDMGCHVMDGAFSALKLHYPVSIEASSTPLNSETEPLAAIVHYQFPERADMPAVKLHWYNGGLMPARPEELEPARKLPKSGSIFAGDKGKIMCGCYADSPRIIPEAKMKAYKRPPKTIARISGSHEQNWVDACKGGQPACSNFDYSGLLTEVVLLGNIAIRTGEKLNWDGPGMKCTNVPKANEYVHARYRDGWSL